MLIDTAFLKHQSKYIITTPHSVKVFCCSYDRILNPNPKPSWFARLCALWMLCPGPSSPALWSPVAPQFLLSCCNCPLHLTPPPPPTVPPGMWDLGSLTKDWTYIPYSGSTEPSHWTNREFPWCSFLLGMPFTFDILVASNSTWIFFSHPSFATSPTSWCWLYLKLHWGPSCLTDLGQFPLLHALTILFLCSEIIILAVFTHSRVELIRVCPHLAPDSIIPWAWTSAPLSYPTTQGSVWSKAGTED